MRMLASLAWRISLGVIVLGTGTAAAQEPTPAETFAAALQEVEADLHRQKWERAADGLRALLAAHAGKPYVIHHRPTIADVFETCRFWTTHERPDPKDLVSGQLVRYSKSGGNLKVVYGPDQLEDFLLLSEGGTPKPMSREVRSGDLLLHSALFAGPHTMRIEGVTYPPHGSPLPVLLACYRTMPRVVGIVATLGMPRKDMGRAYYPAVPATLSLRGEEVDNLDYQEQSPARAEDRCALKLQVTATGVSAHYDGKKVLSGRKPRDLFGYVGFRGIADFERIIIEGKAERSWMQGRIDAEVDRMWEEFAAVDDPAEDLPAWLAVAPNAWEEAFPPAAYPGEPREGQEEIFAEVLDALRQGMTVKQLKAVRDLAPDAVTDAFRAYAICLLLNRRGRYEDAFAKCREVRELDPGFLPAEILHIELVGHLQGVEEAIEMLRERIRVNPAEGWPHPTLAKYLLQIRDREGAAAVIEAAVTNAAYTAGLDEVNRILTKVRRGPRWGESHEYSSKHYHVVSDLDRATCIEAAEALETAVEYYATNLGRRERQRERFRVFVFSGEAGYQRYLKDVIDFEPENTLGVFLPVLEQLLVWNAPDRDDMMRTVRHEGLHQYVDDLMDDPPAWLNEGLAEYWEGAELTALERFPPRSVHLRVLADRKTKWTPLKILLHADHDDFMRKAEVNYSESWALVHFLHQTTPDYRSRFRDLLSRLGEGQDRHDAIDAAFAGIDGKELERELREYVASLD